METKNNSIELKQIPIIHHDLISIGNEVTKRIDELQLDKLVATEATVKSLKATKAELNKEFAEFETQRKAIKSKVLEPYNAFEVEYKEHIANKYTNASKELTPKIGEVEIKIKEERKASIVDYFNELCVAQNIDFITFANTKIVINLSTSLKKYKEQCTEFVQKVADDIILINSQEHKVEILVEYKKTLNASKAITDVLNRKADEKAEKDKALFKRTQDRKSKLTALSFVYHDLTKSYAFVSDDSIEIELNEIETLEDDAFLKKFVDLEENVTAIQALRNKTTTTTPSAPEPKTQQEVKKETLSAPVVESKPKTYKAVFQCNGTKEQLTALGQYMKDNNITYKNI